MSSDEQMAVLGRMVTERKELKTKEAALSDETVRAHKELRNIAGLIGNYHAHYNIPLKIPATAMEFLDAEKLVRLVDDLLSTRTELHALEARLKQAGID